MKKFSMVLVGLVAVSLWAATLYGEDHHRFGMGGRGSRGMMRGGPGMMLPLMLRGVDLTADQEKQVKEIMANHRQTFRTLFKQSREADQELADKLFAPGAVQADDLTPLTEKISQLREQLMQEGLKTTLEVRGILTPEQIAGAAQRKERMRELRSEMRSLFKDKKAKP